jgi:hypothetical protein
MKQSINTIAIIILMIFLGCSKKDTTPNTNNINNTTLVNAKWIQIRSSVQYAPDGVTEATRQEWTYDSEGRTIGGSVYYNGVLGYKYRDYAYIGDECTFYTDQYVSGSIYSTTKTKNSYKNN